MHHDFHGLFVICTAILRRFHKVRVRFRTQAAEVHGYRCPALDVAWPRLAFPWARDEALRDRSASRPAGDLRCADELVVEYRLRARTRAGSFNEACAPRPLLQ